MKRSTLRKYIRDLPESDNLDDLAKRAEILERTKPIAHTVGFWSALAVLISITIGVYSDYINLDEMRIGFKEKEEQLEAEYSSKADSLDREAHKSKIILADEYEHTKDSLAKIIREKERVADSVGNEITTAAIKERISERLNLVRQSFKIERTYDDLVHRDFIDLIKEHKGNTAILDHLSYEYRILKQHATDSRVSVFKQEELIPVLYAIYKATDDNYWFNELIEMFERTYKSGPFFGFHEVLYYRWDCHELRLLAWNFTNWCLNSKPSFDKVYRTTELLNRFYNLYMYKSCYHDAPFFIDMSYENFLVFNNFRIVTNPEISSTLRVLSLKRLRSLSPEAYYVSVASLITHETQDSSLVITIYDTYDNYPVSDDRDTYIRSRYKVPMECCDRDKWIHWTAINIELVEWWEEKKKTPVYHYE